MSVNWPKHPVTEPDYAGLEAGLLLGLSGTSGKGNKTAPAGRIFTLGGIAAQSWIYKGAVVVAFSRSEPFVTGMPSPAILTFPDEALLQLLPEEPCAVRHAEFRPTRGSVVRAARESDFGHMVVFGPDGTIQAKASAGQLGLFLYAIRGLILEAQALTVLES